LEILQAATEQGPAIDSSSGIVAWLRGEFDTARVYFDRATSGLVGNYEQRIQALWFVPHDPAALAYDHLAWDRQVHRDLAGAEFQLRRAVQRSDQLGQPQSHTTMSTPST
jgi:hypothetical protein